jgi:hypothetical protein
MWISNLLNINYKVQNIRKCKLKETLNKKKFEDTKGVIRICKLKKSRQYNGQRKKDKQWSTQITKNWVKRTQLETRGELRFARSFVFCVLLDRCLSVCPFSFGHCVVCLSSISGFLYYLVGISKLFLMTIPGSTTLVKKPTNINKRNNHLSPQIIEHKKEI